MDIFSSINKLTSSTTLRGTTLTFFDQAIGSLTGFLTVVLVARICTPDQVGIYSLVMTFFFLARSYLERSLAAPYVVYVHRCQDDELKLLLGSSLVFQLIYGIGSGLLCALISICFYFKVESNLWGACLALGIALPFLLARDHLRAVSLAQFQIKSAFVISSAVCFVQLPLLLVFLRMTPNVPLVFLIMGFACFVSCLCWLATSQCRFLISREKIVQHWSLFWNYSKFLVIARIFGTASRIMMPWLIVYFLNQTEAGKFAVYLNLVGLSMTFLVGVNNFLQPRSVMSLQNGGVVLLIRTLRQTILLFSLVLSGVWCLFFFGGDYFLGMIYGASYAKGGTVLSILAANILVLSYGIAFSNGLAAFGRAEGNLYGECITFIATLVSSLLLIPMFDLHGAAWAMLAGNGAGGLVLFLALYKLLSAARREEGNSQAGEQL